MENIARNAGTIYLCAVLLMIVNGFVSINEAFQDSLSIVTFIIVLVVKVMEIKLLRNTE